MKTYNYISPFFWRTMRREGVLTLLLLIMLGGTSCQEEDLIVQSLYDVSGARLIYEDSQASKFINVVAVSMQVSYDKDENIDQLKRLCSRAVNEHPDTELILFGESILGWYIDEDEPENYQELIAEPIPGPAVDEIALVADSLNIYLAFGLTEKRNDTLFNSQILLNPNGEVEAVHRKINLTQDDLSNGIIAGPKTEDNVTLVTINGIRTGLIVCADVSGYWLTKQLVNKNVELILHSLASEVPEFVFDPVARQFNAWEVFANRFGSEGKRNYSGLTYIADPSGSIRSGASKSAIYMYHRIAVR